MNVQQFGKLIFDAVKSTQSEERGNSEKILLEFKESNPVEFIQMATQILIDEKGQSELRQASGTLIKRVLTMSSTAPIWDRLNEQQKNQIKDMLLQTLVTPDLMARRATADVIASICGIELPRKEWPNIISILVAQTNNQSEDIKKAAVMTLGFICENLKDKSASLDHDMVKQIMAGILVSMRAEQTNDDIRYMGVKALQDSLQFMANHLETPDIRVYMMQQLMFCLKSNIFKIRVRSLQCLVEFARLYVQHLDQFLFELTAEVQKYLEDDDLELSVISVEFFNTIAQEELAKKSQRLQLTERFAMEVVPKLLKNLTKEVQDEEDNGLGEASENCLCSIMEISDDKVTQVFTVFIQNTISQPDQNLRRAAMMAFGAMIEGQNKEQLKGIIESGLSHICQSLMAQEDMLACAASSTLSKVAELFPLTILNHPDLHSIIVCLLNSLPRKVSISKNVCWVFNLLAEEYPQLYQRQPHHPIFEQHLDNIVKSLFQNTQRNVSPQDLTIIDVSYLAIMNILHNIDKEDFQRQYLAILIDLFKNAGQVQGPQQQNVKSGVQACLHQSVTKQTNIKIEECQAIYDLIIQDFQAVKDVHSDGLYVMSALATVMEEQFVPLLPNSYSYIKHGLSKVNDIDLFKSSLGTLGDICRSCPAQFEHYLAEVIPALLNCINLQTIDKTLKLAVFNCLGDIALSCPHTFQNYIDEVVKVYNLGFVGAVSLQGPSQSQDNQDYGEQLKECLVESYTCFVHAMQDLPPAKDKVKTHLPTVVQFIEKTCDQALNPTIDFIRLCLTLIADIANFFKDEAAHLVKTNFSQQLIHNLNRFSSIKENKEVVQFAVQTLSKLQVK